MDSVSLDRRISREDVEVMYSGLFMGAITSFESYLQELFMQAALGRVQFSSVRRVRPRLSVPSKTVLHELVLQNRGYVDWLPYDETVKRAKVFLANGEPFSSLCGDDKGKLTEYMKIRNAIAHVSQHAHEKFIKDIAVPANLPPRSRTPGGYLTSRISPPGGQSRLEAILGELNRIGLSLI